MLDMGEDVPAYLAEPVSIGHDLPNVPLAIDASSNKELKPQVPELKTNELLH